MITAWFFTSSWYKVEYIVDRDGNEVVNDGSRPLEDCHGSGVALPKQISSCIVFAILLGKVNELLVSTKMIYVLQQAMVRTR